MLRNQRLRNFNRDPADVSEGTIKNGDSAAESVMIFREQRNVYKV